MKQIEADLSRISGSLDEAESSGDPSALERARSELEKLATTLEYEWLRLRRALREAEAMRRQTAGEIGWASRDRAIRGPDRPPTGDGEEAGIAVLLRAIDPEAFRSLLAREDDLTRKGPGPDALTDVLQGVGGLGDKLDALASRLRPLASLPLHDERYRSELDQVLALDARLRAGVLARSQETSDEPGA